MFIPNTGSPIRLFSIPDPGSASKNLSILTPKKPKKWFLSSRKYDPSCSSRIPDPGANCIGTNCIGNKLYRHKLYRHNLYWHNLYRTQTVSGTNCIGHKLYRAQIVSCNKLYLVTNCIGAQIVSGHKLYRGTNCIGHKLYRAHKLYRLSNLNYKLKLYLYFIKKIDGHMAIKYIRL
jgi:hypothetical protein